ncbi:putative high mobility group B protein 11 isoform X1 [Tanacetum coccineum]
MALSNETAGICIDTNKQPHYSDNNNNMLNVFTSVDDNDADDDDDNEYCYACSSSLTTVRKSLSPAVSAPRSKKSKDEMEEEDGFYHKLNKINEPSGLSLLFNLRDTSMDLHEFYNAVTKRGGYQQVTKDGKWEDVASSLNRMNQVSFTSTQLLQLYAIILYPFERTYYYRSTVKLDKIAVTHDISQVSWISNLGSGKVLGGCQSNASAGKRKHDDGLHATQYVFSDVEPPYKKIEFNNSFWKSSPEVSLAFFKTNWASSVGHQDSLGAWGGDVWLGEVLSSSPTRDFYPFRRNRRKYRRAGSGYNILPNWMSNILMSLLDQLDVC